MTIETVQSHVMVVEDDKDTREVVKLILELEGMWVTEASDGFEALERLHTLRISCVWTNATRSRKSRSRSTPSNS